MRTYDVQIYGHRTAARYFAIRRQNKQCLNCESCYLDAMWQLHSCNPLIETAEFEKMNFKVQKGKSTGKRSSTVSPFVMQGPEPDKCLMAGTVNERKSMALIEVMSCANDEFQTELSALKAASQLGGASHFMAAAGELSNYDDLGIEENELAQILKRKDVTTEEKSSIILSKIQEALRQRSKQKGSRRMVNKKDHNQFPAWDILPAIHPGRMMTRALDKTGWTKEHFAEVAGIPLETITNILDQKEMPSPEEIVKISKALDMKVEGWVKMCELYEAKKAGWPRPKL